MALFVTNGIEAIEVADIADAILWPGYWLENDENQEVCAVCGTVDPEPWDIDPNDPPAWACGQDPERCDFCGSL